MSFFSFGLWQTLILSQWQPMLAYLPVESVVRVRQSAYYQALAEADKSGDSTVFIEFMLQALQDTLIEVLSKTSEKIIAALQQNSSLTIAELAKSVGVATQSIERNLQKLQDEGRLRRIGPDKGGHWHVLK